LKKISDSDPYVLPVDLLAPVDDGACQHLTEMKIPTVSLRSTRKEEVNLAEASQQPTVFFFYPETGKPGVLIPRDWNEIPGARGCTPQACAFRDHYAEFKRLGFEIFGVSAQPFVEQQEFATRNNLPYALLNDSDFELTKRLRLPTFEFQSKVFLKRLALVSQRGRIVKVFYPVFPPDKNADEAISYLKSAKLLR